jgi:hypothetical protein
MTRGFLLFAVLLLLMSPVSGRVPELNIKALCKARSDAAKVLRSTPDQSIADCVHDEEAAKQQLSTLWASTPAPLRNQCEGDARSLGTMSYLDLLTCMQMADDTKLDPKRDTGKR